MGKIKEVWVALTPQDIIEVDKVGRKRMDMSIEKDRPANNGTTTDKDLRLPLDLRGARGEFSTKCFLDPIEWHAISYGKIKHLPDLGDFIDVKTARLHQHSLIIQKDDHRDWAYVLVTAESHPVYRLVGWLWGYEGMKEEFWTDPVGERAAYFIKKHQQHILHSMDELLDIKIARERKKDGRAARSLSH